MNREEELLCNALNYIWDVVNDICEYEKVLERLGFTDEEIEVYGGLE